MHVKKRIRISPGSAKRLALAQPAEGCSAAGGDLAEPLGLLRTRLPEHVLASISATVPACPRVKLRLNLSVSISHSYTFCQKKSQFICAPHKAGRPRRRQLGIPQNFTQRLTEVEYMYFVTSTATLHVKC